MSRELEKDIETLLKGNVLKGVKGSDDEEGKEQSDYSELQLDSINEEMQKFTTAVTPFLQDPALKALTPRLQRDFVVLVRDSVFNITTGKLLSKYEQINVLVGPKADIEALEGKVKEFMTSFKGSFKSEYKLHAT